MSEQANRTPSDAVLTVPNILTFVRLGLVPLFLWVALGLDRLDLAFLIALTGVITDLVDGRIARRYGQISKLGIALDPLADRLGLASGIVVFFVHDLAPLWIPIAVAARDGLLVLVGAPIMKAAGAEIPPVSRVGKAGSFLVSLSFGLFFLSAWPGVDEQIDALRILGIITALVALPLYYASGLGYVRAGVAALRSRERT